MVWEEGWSQSTGFRGRQAWAPYSSLPPTGPPTGLKPQCPLKRAIILPHRMILGLNEINSVCKALVQWLAHCQCSINVVSENVFSSSPTCVQVGSAA